MGVWGAAGGLGAPGETKRERKKLLTELVISCRDHMETAVTFVSLSHTKHFSFTMLKLDELDIPSFH